jgi:hypothetical protein
MTDDSNTPSQDLKEWESGNEPATDAQLIHAEALAAEAGEPMPDETISKAEAAEKIEELKSKVGEENEDGMDAELSDNLTLR